MGKKVTVGYKYSLGMHMIQCHGPVDSVNKIEVDGRVAWSGSSTGGQIFINQPGLFGGEDREGGIVGYVDVEMGSTTQGQNSYLLSKLGSLVPSYRGVLGLVLRQVYLGTSPYIKPWSVWATRIHKRQNGMVQWYDAKAAIGTDMNPAHIVRECLTDTDWGMGYLEADVDETSFVAAADQLYSEGMGISLLWDRAMPLEEFIQEIMKHIHGSLYVDRSSGKFVLKLARGGYDVASLITLDENSVNRVTDFKRSLVGELVNSITVVFWDASTGQNNTVTVQDIALAAQQRATIGTTRQFPGFTNGAIATLAAWRELKAVSTPLASCTLFANRKASSLNIGDVFKFSWGPYGIVQLVMRVVNIEFGALDSNIVKISCVEDVFGLSAASYAAPPSSGWSNPITAPAPSPYRSCIEAPYWELVQMFGDATAAALAPSVGYAMATGVRPSGDSVNALLYSDPYGTGYEEKGVAALCPTATLTAGVTPASVSFQIQGGVDLDLVRIGSYAVIDSEFVGVLGVTDTYVNVGRGVLDTVPAAHATGARLLFIDDFLGTDAYEYATGEVAKAKLLPVTGQGPLALASAPENTVTMAARQARPYPPGRVRFNNLTYPTSLSMVSSTVVSVEWSSRNRLQQTVRLVDSEEVSVTPEAGTTYNIRFYAPGNVLLSSQTGLTALNASYDTSLAPTIGSVLMMYGDGTDGSTTFVDDAGHVVTAFGNAQISTAQSKWGGSSMKFDGAGDYLTVADSPDWDLGTGDFTFEAWIYMTNWATSESGSYDASICSRDVFPNRGFRFNLNGYTTSYDQLRFIAYTLNGGSYKMGIANYSFALNTWYHVAACRANGVIYLFVNGALLTVAGWTDLNIDIGNSSNPLRVGSVNYTTGDDDYFPGYIEDLHIMKGVAKYTASFTPPAAPIVPAYSQLGSVRVELESQRDGLVSHQKHNWEMTLTY